jgi:hypothetical protein
MSVFTKTPPPPAPAAAVDDRAARTRAAAQAYQDAVDARVALGRRLDETSGLERSLLQDELMAARKAEALAEFALDQARAQQAAADATERAEALATLQPAFDHQLEAISAALREAERQQRALEAWIHKHEPAIGQARANALRGRLCPYLAPEDARMAGPLATWRREAGLEA